MLLELLNTPDQIAQSYAVMRQLRPKLTSTAYVEQVRLQQKLGYQLLGVFISGRCTGLAGFVINHKLAWGKHLYVDDLVTDEAARSRGVGLAMLRWLTDYARDQGCQELHLDSGVQRFAAHRFYLRDGFDITSHHFAKSL